MAWGRWYIAVVAVAGAVAGLVASAADANKNQLGYAIYVTLTVFGVVVSSALAYWANRVLDIPTLFAALAFLRRRVAWVAALIVALLVVLMFHLALPLAELPLRGSVTSPPRGRYPDTVTPRRLLAVAREEGHAMTLNDAVAYALEREERAAPIRPGLSDGDGGLRLPSRGAP